MSNKRRHQRTNLRCKFKIWNDSIGEVLVTTRDISDGGVFLILDSTINLPIGTQARGQVQGMMADAPIVAMEVVRMEPAGVGLKFIPDPQ
ncbi:MAG: PilZ domain-containing protein [Pseudomonadota bacterium]